MSAIERVSVIGCVVKGLGIPKLLSSSVVYLRNGVLTL
jgi:hypothetical protein